MKSIKIQCPAKINLDLKVIGKRQDGFHNIESVMQTISLYDYLTITIEDSDSIEILLDGSSQEIPYDESNLVYKAAKLFLEHTKINSKVSVYIDKNIPIAAGLAGGSTDAVGTLYGLNKLYNNVLDTEQLHLLSATLGSDLNVCLMGGRIQTSGRGEKVVQLPFEEFTVNLIKPKYLGISAKEAYSKFAYKFANKLDLHTRQNFVNDLEWAIFEDYDELRYIKNNYPTSIMTGSGSTYFSLDVEFKEEQNFWIRNGLKSTINGVKQV